MENKIKVYECINKIQAALSRTGISKDKRNTMQNYSFRGIDDIYNALAPLLAEHNLVILPKVLSREITERVSQKGGTLFYVVLEMEFMFICPEDGSSHVVSTYGEAMDSGDKATNKAMSAAYKYAVMQTFCIPTEGGDNDSETQTFEIVPKKSASNNEISEREILLLQGQLADVGKPVRNVLDYFKINTLNQMSKKDYETTMRQLHVEILRNKGAANV